MDAEEEQPDGVKVIFPCDLLTWRLVRQRLQYFLERELFHIQTHKNTTKLVEVLDTVWKLSKDQVHLRTEEFTPDKSLFHGLKRFLDTKASAEELHTFFHVTLPCIARCAVNIEYLKPSHGMEYSRSQKGSCHVLERGFVASIVACAFLCLFPERVPSISSRLNHINFSNFFLHLPTGPQCAKLRCILHYFERLTHKPVSGHITFTRLVMSVATVPGLDSWLRCRKRLCPLIVHNTGRIEEAGCHTLQVDFANRYIGGGVLSAGRVQEEIRFCVSPELLASLLFTECMADNEAVVISGFQQFSRYTGYDRSMKYAGDCQETSQRENSGNFEMSLCAIDAVAYTFMDKRKQYATQAILRDVNKAFIGFSQPDADRTRLLIGQSKHNTRNPTNPHQDNQSEEEFHSAAGSLKENGCEGGQAAKRRKEPDSLNIAQRTNQSHDSNQRSNAHRVQSQEVVAEEEETENQGAYGPIPEENQSIHNQLMLEMQQFEQNHSPDQSELEKSWLNQFRRRSSNLSDLSRRSSCSTRYSSDFSSEFEEYFEGFQKQEKKHRQPAIQEEMSFPNVNDFAGNLVADILKEGTVVAAQRQPGVQQFGASKPQNITHRPQPIRVENIVIPSDQARAAALPSHGEASSPRLREYVDDIFSRPSAPPEPRNKSEEEKRKQEANVQAAILYVEKMFNETLKVPGTTSGNSSSDDNELLAPALGRNPVDYLSSDQSPDPAQMERGRQAPPPQYPSSASSDSNRASASSSSLLNYASNLSKDAAAQASAASFLVTQNVRPVAPPREQRGERSGGAVRKKDFNSRVQERDINRNLRSNYLQLRSANIVAERIMGQVFRELTNEFRTNSEFRLMVTRGRDRCSYPHQQPKKARSRTSSSNLSTEIEKNGIYAEYLDSLFSKTETNNLPSATNNGTTNSLDRFADNLLRNVFRDALREFYNGTTAEASQQDTQLSCEMVALPDAATQRKNSIYFEQEFGLSDQNHRHSNPDISLSDFAADLARRNSLEDDQKLNCPVAGGFRDMTLSTFAEELYRSNPNSPSLAMFKNACRNSSIDKSISSRSSSDWSMRRSSSEKGSWMCSSNRTSLDKSDRRSSSSSNRSSISRDRSRRSTLDLDWFRSSRQSDFLGDYKIEEQQYSESSSFEWFIQDMIFDAFNRAFQQMFMVDYIKLWNSPKPSPMVTPASNSASFSSENITDSTIEGFAERMTMAIMQDALNEVAKIVSPGSYHRLPLRSHDSDSQSQRSSSYEDAMDVPYGDVTGLAGGIAESILSETVVAVAGEGGASFTSEPSECPEPAMPGERLRPIATGNWGCGAFGGDAQFKALLQWLAASYADAPAVLYYTFGNPHVADLAQISELIQMRRWRVGDLMAALLQYQELVTNVDTTEKPASIFTFLSTT